jgi:hypothetical protein
MRDSRVAVLLAKHRYQIGMAVLTRYANQVTKDGHLRFLLINLVMGKALVTDTPSVEANCSWVCLRRLQLARTPP